MPRETVTERQCAVTREVKPVDELVRFALGPDNIVVPDVEGKAPGRGVWVTLYAPMVAEAARRKIFARSLKQAVTVPPDLAQLTATRLEQRLLGALGLARKAGQLVTGAAKVRSAIDKPGIVALFTATDAAADGRGKLMGAAGLFSNGDAPRHFELLASGQLGLALGLENVIHAALIEGPAAGMALVRAERLARYLGKQSGSADQAPPERRPANAASDEVGAGNRTARKDEKKRPYER